MRLKVASLLAVASFAFQALAATAPADTFFGLHQPETMKVCFTQEKRIPGIPKTLRASGHLVFSRQLGAIWRIEQPRPREIAMPVGNNRASAAEKEVTATIASVVSGDLAALRRHFDITASPARDDGGTVVLRPRVAAVRDVITAVTLRISGQAIREIQIQEASGGVIELAFTPPQLDYALTEADKTALKEPRR